MQWLSGASDGVCRAGHDGFPAEAKLSDRKPNHMQPIPDPFLWDTPSLTWDSAVTWDGLAPTTRNKPMSTTKAITDFSKYKDGDLGPAAQFIHDQMLANAATFTAPTVTMAALQTLITTYNTKLVAKASRASADTVAFRAARAALEPALSRLGNYVNDVAQGDVNIVELSGFPSYSTASPSLTGAPPAPQNLRLSRGSVAGSILARYKPQLQPSTNEVQINTGSVDTPADWHTAGIFKGQTAEITGLTPGARVWVRVRTVGLKGVMGDWSDPAEIIVT